MADKKTTKTPMLEQFMAIKNRHKDSILFYRMGDFYEMFYEDAEIASEVLGLRLTSRAHGKKSMKVPLAGFPYHQLDNYLTRMVNAGHRVVICEQVEDPKAAKGLVKRDVVQVVTAGTNPAAVDTIETTSNRIAALIREGKSFGYAWANLATGEFSAGEFDKEEVIRVASHINPVELVVPESQSDILARILTQQSLPLLSKLVDWVWEDAFSRKTLLDHFETINLKGFGIEGYSLAIAASGALLYYMKSNLHSDPVHLTSLSRADLSNKLILEPSTRKNLELAESITGNHTATLFSVINKTVTTSGRRHLYNWLMEPLTDKELIEERLNSVSEFADDRSMSVKLRELLRNSGDLQKFVAHLATGRGSARDLVAIRDTLSCIPDFKDCLKSSKSIKTKKLKSNLNELPDLQKLLFEALTDEPPISTSEGGMIKDGYNQELDELKGTSRSGRTWLDNYAESERERTGIPKLKVAYNRVFGFYIEVTNSQLDKIPENYVRKQTLVSAERFITPELKEYEEGLLKAEERIYELELEIFNFLTQETLSRSTELQADALILAELDVLSSLAVLAAQEKYSRPIITNDEKLELVDSRHPVVEKHLPAGESFIPNNLTIGDETNRLLIITGPNMAGKSTYLRQVALCVILAQLGSFVPAKAATIGIVDKLFTRIGAHDNLAGGESTFLVEMQETASILHNATTRSLVIFDEVGRGTSTFDGLSLAWSIVEFLHESPQLNPRTLFATHFHEMTDLENYLPSVKNMNVAVKEYADKIVFLRKIIPGGCDSSFGIHVAQMAGLPPAVIGRAKEVMQNLEANDLTPGILSENDEAVGKGEQDANESKSAIDSNDKRMPKKHVAQLSLFDPGETKVREMLSLMDIESMTPIEALQALAELKNELEN